MKLSYMMYWSMLYYTLYSIFILAKDSLIEGRQLYLPVLHGSSWQPANPMTLTCPTIAPTYDSSTDTTLMDVFLMKPNSEKLFKRSGFLCHSIKFIVECDEGLFGSIEVTKKIEKVPAETSRCLEAISKYKVGDLLSPGFPDQQCKWNDKLIISVISYQITEHSVILDPYTGNTLDPLFTGGISRPSKSETIHPDLRWFPLEDTSFRTCINFQSAKGLIYNKGNGTIRDPGETYAYLHIPGYKDLAFNGSCLLRYCETPGVRFQNGEWFAIKADLGKSVGQPALLTNLPNCSRDASIRLSSTTEDLAEESEINLNLMYTLKCQEGISKLISGEPVSPYDISFMVQAHPGLGNVFILGCQHLMVALGDYKAVNVIDREGKDQRIGTLEDGEDYYLPEFPANELCNRSQHHINGIMEVDGRIMYPPGLTVKAQVNNWLLRGLPLHPVPHPSTIIIQNITDLIDEDPDLNYEITDLGHTIWWKVSNFWEGVKFKVYIVLLVLLVFFTAFLFLRFCPRLCFRGCKWFLCGCCPRPQNGIIESDLELGGYVDPALAQRALISNLLGQANSVSALERRRGSPRNNGIGSFNF